jgi:N-acetyl-alpha-D-glucosaminyl L-malate synthase BshA
VLGGRPPVVTTLHGTDVTLLAGDPSFADVVRFSMERSDALTAVSEALRRETEAWLQGSRPVETVYNFIDPEAYRRLDPPPLPPGGEPVLIHISNFRPVKRVPLVVEIFARVHARRPCRLWLVGDGPDSAEARQQAARLGVLERVVFWGKQESVVPLLSAADVLLLPSRQESFGLAALEAMACEVPVVATRVGGVPEVVADGETGLLFDPDDVEGMVAGCLRLLGDPELRRAMGAAGRRRAVEQFAAERIVPRYEAIYRRLAGKG